MIKDGTFTLELDVTQLNAENAFRAQSARWFKRQRWPFNDLWFVACVHHGINRYELIEQFDRLMGTNLRCAGNELEFLIDKASGRFDHDFELFLDFVRDRVYAIIPRPPEFDLQHTR